jgi:ADP-heptose:LPS heptosyltransferase
MKFLVIRFSSIGDIVLASPVLRCLKKQIVTSEIHFLTRSDFKIVTEANPYADRFFYYDDNLYTLIRELKKERYDYVIDLHNNFRSNKIKRAIGAPFFTIDKLNWQKLLLTKLHVDFMPGRHITTRSLDTVARFGVKDDGGGLDYFIPAKDIIRESDIPTSHLAGYVAIVIGASYHTKKLPVHKLIALCGSIHHPIILLGGKEDLMNGELIAATNKPKIYNACGKFNLNESADLIRRAKLVVSNDTGLQYIASAFRKPTLAIWGSTSPRLDVEPYYGSEYLQRQKELPYENIFVPGLKCQPCSKYGNDKCPLGHFKCMEQQDVEHIVQRVNYRLGH